ncbi:HigA family addiction module antitoxin [Silvimonas iriomotensis]|uniref:Transcriptional regulator n=1 Tax=Silvimonas iriomotensis TaxID=449662 RepID=A0ABQ2P7C8_9NEIS|nr:HigA family addiction module antitoxin [Silvimonas iriomotensis]GGP20180.1 transcriptional regulator [Silvimonas iriomotensis]
MQMHNPPHPGEVLKAMWLDPSGISISELAARIGQSRTIMSRIVNGHASVTPEMAMRLSIALGTTPQVWMNLQNAHDLWQWEQRRAEFNITPFDLKAA